MSLEERLAIQEFETLAAAIVLRGYYKPGGDSGSSLRVVLAKSRPALYPHVADPDRVDASALCYVMLRLPDDFWTVRQITVSREISTAVHDDFPAVATAARRRPTYRTGPDSYATVLHGGMTDLLDFTSAVTCFQIEADKIRAKYRHHVQKKGEDAAQPGVWEEIVALDPGAEPAGGRNSLLHALSVEFRAPYDEVKALDATLGGRLPAFVRSVVGSGSKDLTIVFADAFGLVADYGARAKVWSASVCRAVEDLGLSGRDVYLVSSNQHSLFGCVSPYVREEARRQGWSDENDYARVRELMRDEAARTARTKRDAAGGLHVLETSGHMPFCQLVDLAAVDPALVDGRIGWRGRREAVVVNMDYAFGEEGFFLLNELLENLGARIRGVYIMGKAGTLVGRRGDIMLPTFFVKLGSGDVYGIGNCMTPEDFAGLDDVRAHDGGPMVTVAGTFLQNRVVLEYFRDRWGALGVEMEGTPYARALAQAKLRKRVRDDVCVGVAYYASDVPLASDLLTVPLGEEGVRATYAVTIAILRDILGRTPETQRPARSTRRSRR